LGEPTRDDSGDAEDVPTDESPKTPAEDPPQEPVELRIHPPAEALTVNMKRIEDAEFTPDGKYVIACTRYGKPNAALWNIETGELLRVFNGHPYHGPSRLAVHPNGTHFATGSWDGTVVVFDIATGKTSGVIEHKPETIFFKAGAWQRVAINEACRLENTIMPFSRRRSVRTAKGLW
jgi:WD40 repeat protein